MIMLQSNDWFTKFRTVTVVSNKLLKIGVNAKRIKEQQHQIKYEPVLFLQRQTEVRIKIKATALSNIGLTLITEAYHSEHTAWFLDAECLHHLEHIHNALCLAAFSGIDERTEHSTPTHCITTRYIFMFTCMYGHVFMCVWVCVCVCMCFGASNQASKHMLCLYTCENK